MKTIIDVIKKLITRRLEKMPFDDLVIWYCSHKSKRNSWNGKFARKRILNLLELTIEDDLEQALWWLKNGIDDELFEQIDNVLLKKIIVRDLDIRTTVKHWRRIPDKSKVSVFLEKRRKELLGKILPEITDAEQLFHLDQCGEKIIYDRFSEIIAQESSIKKLMSLYRYHDTKARNIVDKRLIEVIYEGGEKALIEFLVESYQVDAAADE